MEVPACFSKICRAPAFNRVPPSNQRWVLINATKAFLAELAVPHLVGPAIKCRSLTIKIFKNKSRGCIVAALGFSTPGPVRF
jgi:hypothetical protein